MRDTRREGAVGRNIGSAAFVSRHVRWVRAVRRGVFGGSASEGPVSGRRFCRWRAPRKLRQDLSVTFCFSSERLGLSPR